MLRIKYKVVQSGVLVKNRCLSVLNSQKGPYSQVESLPERLLCAVETIGFSSTTTGKNAFNKGNAETARRVVLKLGYVSKSTVDMGNIHTDVAGADAGLSVLFREWLNRDHIISSHIPYRLTKFYGQPCKLRCYVRSFASSTASQSSGQTSQEKTRKDISTVEDPFDAPIYNIPEKPVTFAEGASYSIIILAGL